ncbi:MAG: gliding motility-associated C-terminal domain-containing protein [Flavobacteriales bacterium]|nr:gliding motility-associated C-terminal domain-containing protein [Flavobacteriales bacterium]
MNRFNYVFKCVFVMLVALALNSPFAKAAHIPSGELYWECITSGPDAGKFIFYMTAYRDCSSSTAFIAAPQLTVLNCPTLTSLGLSEISRTDVTPSNCGLTCADGIQDISIEKFVFASAPVAIPGPPPAQGYVFIYEACCRINSDNLVNPLNQNIYYTATMYPYNSQDTYPCYDSSPQFSEKPSAAKCSGYPLRYNSNATDANLDSLSYEFVQVLGSGGLPIAYQSGFSPTEPLPGPSQSPPQNLITLDPVTGQLEYDSSPNIQGRFAVAIAVTAWRCGQRVSRTIRDITLALVACPEPNNIPSISTPAWTAPATGTGYSVTVNAGDLINFTLSGTDNDLTGGVPQIMEFTATGSQFGTNYSNVNAGCLNPPCATLSNSTPPSSGSGTISTTFNWQTTCDHVAVQEGCGNLTTTYNFLFKFKDNYCPASGTNTVNVSVTVVGEPIIESPPPHCASTAANGDITLSWDPVVDNNVPQSFVEYAIFHSTSANGPFTQEIGAVTNIGTGTYTHTAANPVAAPSTSSPNYYVIRTRSGCNDAILEAPIDTIASIFLTLANTGVTANLNWNAVATPALASSTGPGLYDVYREYPAGTWTVIATTTNLSYVDPIIWCNEQVNYRVELSDNLPCTSVSNVVGDILNNPAMPDPQAIDSVTVVNELARISWLPNTQLNVVEYTVEQNNAGIWTPLFTAAGYNNTDWINPASNAGNVSEIYRVKATNNCQVTGNPVTFARTILASVVADGCEKYAEVRWSEYVNWPEGVRAYEIHTSKDGATEILIGTVDDTTFVFRHENVEDEATYCYRVVAVRDTPTRITSTSNDTCVLIYVPKRPDYQYNYNTTVITGNTGVEEFFFVDSTAGYIGFQIQRGTEPDDMRNLWFMPFDVSTRYYQYTDASARPAFNSYYYWVIGVDSCQLNADTMNMSRTILLDAEANSDRTNSLEWNAYEGWNGPVTAYNIHRSVDGVYAYLTTVPPTQLTYTDSIQEIIIGDGNFCYIIEAVEGVSQPIGAPNPVLFQELSRSNEDCARQHPNVFTPNAFMPEGVNSVFKPVTVYVDANSYLFQVYNRWGEKIFETTDPDEGWNGSAKGKVQPQGSYVYFVSFLSSKGKEYTKSGSVTLLR